MLKRILLPSFKDYPIYGGRGITVCERWKNFDNFNADMGEKPSRLHSIERIDNGGNYEPGNCRWATLSEQHQNKRTTVFVILEAGGKLCLAEWIRQKGFNPNRVAYHAGEMRKKGIPLLEENFISRLT